MKVLLVDDEPLELEQLAYLIKPRWPMAEIATAEDAFEALKLAQQHKFNLALVDINLPGKSGLELIESLKATNPQLSFIITTAYQRFDYAKKSIQLGVFDYLVKPIIEEELIEVMNRALEKSKFLLAKSPVVEKALAIIEKNYAGKINLEDLAQQIHVSSNHLSKKFSEELGLNFSSFLMKYRIEKAKALLSQNPHYNLALLAEEVGFQSQSYFSNAFKKYEGVTPSEFKDLRLKSYG